VLLLTSCVLYGCTSILPSAVLRHELPCGTDCGVEACFQTPSFWCVLNRTAPFFLQSMMHALAWKLLKLYFSLTNDYYSWQYRLVSRHGGALSMLFPLLCCGMSYAIEIDDPYHPAYALHFVRSAFTCRMRFPNIFWEFCLHYGQIGISACIVLIAVVRVVQLLIRSLVRSSRVRNFESAGWWGTVGVAIAALMQRPKVVKILVLGMVALLMVVLSASLTVLSAPAFVTFNEDMQEWYACVKFDFARSSVFGETEWEKVVNEVMQLSGGEQGKCPPLPQNGPSVALQLTHLLTEALVPMAIAFFFSKLSHFHCPRGFKKAKVSHQVKIKTSVASES